MSSKNVTPQQDTGWGVIYRLNDLFKEVESLAPSGEYDKWNFKLDRIYSNLCYRNSFDIEWNKEKSNIISIDFDEDSYKIKLFLDLEIVKAKKEMRDAIKKVPEGSDYKNRIDYIRAKNKLYKAIFKKEIWLRKYMNELGLYLKEVEYNPAGSMWGK